MANTDRHQTLLADANGNGLIAARQTLVSDPAAITSDADAVTITWTTGDPSITPNAAVTIADGATPTVTELQELAVELNDQVNKLNADVTAVRTALLSALDVLEAHNLMADA